MSASSPPRSSRLVDAVVLGFALWTVCCHAVVMAGGTLPTLLATAAAASLVAIVAGRRFGARQVARLPPPPAIDAEQDSSRSPRLLSALGAGAALGSVYIFSQTGDVLRLWWWGALILLAAGWVIGIHEKPHPFPCPSSRVEAPLLVALMAACVIVTLVSHRPDYDDALYVNFAVAAVDHPDLPLFAHDTMHGINSLPLHLSAYAFYSWELWNAALAWLTGLPAIVCFHLISAALAAALVPLAYARLFRLLAPRVPTVAVTAVLVTVLLAAGETHRWYGNFSFVRIWQGKGVALFIFLPLIYAYGLELARSPSRRGWLLLASAQIAAIGCTSSAIWLAPAASLTAVFCALAPTRRALSVLICAALASAYPLAVGLLLKDQVKQDLRLPDDGPLGDAGTLGDALANALGIVMGDGSLQWVSLAAVLGTWALTPPGSLARRFAIGVPLASWLILLNPYIARWIQLNLSGTASYWRCLWALPIPTLITLAIIAPLNRSSPSLKARLTTGVAACSLLAAFVLFVPRYGGLSRENRVRFGIPRLKVRTDTYRIADALNSSVPPGSWVVAPKAISLWLPTFHNHAFPLQVRHYLDLPQTQARIGVDSYQHRAFLTRYVGGESQAGENATMFVSSLLRFGVSGICLKRSVMTKEVTSMLTNEGFDLVRDPKPYTIWVRQRKASRRSGIFVDGFEHGNTAGWSAVTGLPRP